MLTEPGKNRIRINRVVHGVVNPKLKFHTTMLEKMVFTGSVGNVGLHLSTLRDSPMLISHSTDPSRTLQIFTQLNQKKKNYQPAMISNTLAGTHISNDVCTNVLYIDNSVGQVIGCRALTVPKTEFKVEHESADRALFGRPFEVRSY